MPPRPISQPRIALVGNPNCGKTALFNALTGSRQKVANYPGVTVERKEAIATTPGGLRVHLLDLPGTYSLRARSLDEEITRDVVLGRLASEAAPDLLVCVADATNLRRTLRFALELKRVGRPMILALNMFDIARHRGIDIDLDQLSAELGLPVVASVAVRRGGTRDLLDRIEAVVGVHGLPLDSQKADWSAPSASQLRATQREADHILAKVVRETGHIDTVTRRIDKIVLHPVLGLLVLLAVLFLMFQAVFSWAQTPMDLIKDGFDALGAWVGTILPNGWVSSFLRNGVIAGVGSVIVFLPQILILFLFILLLEDFGYMGRAAFLMDRIMGGAGLHGRAFIPLFVELRLRDPGHHGNTGHRQPPRSAGDDPSGAADDLFGAYSGLHVDHLGLYPQPLHLGWVEPARAGDVRSLRCRHRRRPGDVMADAPSAVAARSG